MCLALGGESLACCFICFFLLLLLQRCLAAYYSTHSTEYRSTATNCNGEWPMQRSCFFRKLSPLSGMKLSSGVVADREPRPFGIATNFRNRVVRPTLTDLRPIDRMSMTRLAISFFFSLSSSFFSLVTGSAQYNESTCTNCLKSNARV